MSNSISSWPTFARLAAGLAIVCVFVSAELAVAQPAAVDQTNGASTSKTGTQKSKPSTPPPALNPSQQQEIDEALHRSNTIREEIDKLERVIERNKTSDSELARIRSKIYKMITKARELSSALAPRLTELKTQIKELSPNESEKDVVTESDQLRENRTRLDYVLSQLTGAQKTADLETVRAQQLRSEIRQLRQSIFANQILQRNPSPLARATWHQLDLDLNSAGNQFTDLVRNWTSQATAQGPSLTALIIASIIIYWVLRVFIRRIMNARLPRNLEPRPNFFNKAANAGWVAPLFALPSGAAAATFLFGLHQLGLLENEIRQITLSAVVPALLILITTYALSRAILQPNRPTWRMLNLEGPAAERITQLLTAIAAVNGLNTILQEIIRTLYLPTSLIVIETALANIAIAALLILLVRTRLNPEVQAAGLLEAEASEDDAATPPKQTVTSRWHPRFIKIPLLLLAGAILVMSLLGYISLGRFLAAQVVVTGSAVALLLLLHLAIRALIGGPGTGRRHASELLQEQVGLGPAQSEGIVQASAIMLNFGLAMIALPLILVTWGVPFDAALSWLKAIIIGFEIGGVKISLARILIAVALFAALLVATRLIQQWLDRTILRPERMDPGIANSIRTGVSYVGFIAAILVGVSYGGLDITNLALVAGALSVGIGFGLQSIVNNFVSGLILLIERPIKVGDWIVVGEHEGHVRRIAVRSTEIETFDRANVIVPNSELITATVQNWTHRNTLGRVIVPVGVAYDADPREVHALLVKAAQDCPVLLAHPAPYVWFEDFGASSLDFSVRGFVANVNNRGTARSELRFAVFKALHEAGIEIPYSQHDIRFRDLDGVRDAINRFAQEREAARQQMSKQTTDEDE